MIGVIATEPATLNRENIQVKTRTIDGKKNSLLMSLRNKKASNKFWYVFVEVGEDDVHPNFFYFQ